MPNSASVPKDYATSLSRHDLPLVAAGLREYTDSSVDPYADLRRAIVAARKARGWSQDQLAQAAGMSRPALSDLETGETSDPRSATVQRVAKALGWTDDQLAAILRGETPGPEVSPSALATARRHLPRAPAAVLERYVAKVAEVERLTDEIGEIEQEYGRPIAQPSPRQPNGET